jgi:hypothetical protein
MVSVDTTSSLAFVDNIANPSFVCGKITLSAS